MRRPDLPLILLVLAVAAALAVFAADDEGVSADGGSEAGAALSPGPFDTALADPVLARCFAGAQTAGDDEEAGGQAPQTAVKTVSQQVAPLRKLRFSEPVDARFLSDPALRRHVGELVERELDPRQTRLEAQVLELLGAIPPQTDLLELTGDALGSQVIGLYDTRTEELLVGSGGELDAAELITLAHELDHALTDQRLGLRDDAGSQVASDRDLAYAALVEGDATLLMELYALAHVTLADQLSLGGTEVGGASEFEALPDYVQRSLVFPYLDGLRLVCSRYVRGGWPAVDRLYSRPPAATDQVIFPDRYGDGAPASPPPGHRLTGEWRSLERRSLGAAELEWLFAAPGGDPAASLPEPRRLIAPWAGGEIELWARGEERALGIALLERRDITGLCGTLGAWYQAANPDAVPEPEEAALKLRYSEPDRAAALSCRGPLIRLGIAPSPAIAASLAR